MNFQRLSMFMSVGCLLLAESAFTLAQPTDEGRVPVPVRTPDQSRNPITQVLFKPSGTGLPPTTRGAGSRNDRHCPQDAPTNSSGLSAQPLALTALIPSNQFGLTWAERPTIWVYLPKTSARQMVLSVREDGAQQHSQRFVPITGEVGIVGIPLAESSPPLEVGKSYQWAVVLLCSDRPNPNDPFVTAWVQRVVAPQLLNTQQSALERATQYGEQGVWYDALTALAESRRSQPADPTLAKIWAEFLAQPNVGLGSIANEPLQ